MEDTYYCPRCNRSLAWAETKRLQVGATGGMQTCAACGDPVRKETSMAQSRVSRPLALEMLLAYGFPLHPRSLALLLPIAVVLALVSGFLGVVYAVLAVLVSYGTLFAIMFAIVRSTAAGEDEISVDSSIADRGEAAAVVVRYLFLVGFCLAPAVVAWALGWPAEVSLGALLLAYLYFPAGLIAASQSGATILDPLLAYRVILAIPVPYLTAVLCLTPAAALWLGSSFVARGILGDGVAAAALGQIVSVFAFAIVARICGVLLREET